MPATTEYNKKYHKAKYDAKRREESIANMKRKRERMGEEAWKEWRKDICTKNRKKPQSKEQQKNYKLLKKYGITLAQRNFLSEQQNHQCLICERQTNYLVVDHCHSTGKVRGLLCRACNAALGVLGDTPIGLQKAIDYLNAHVERNAGQEPSGHHTPIAQSSCDQPSPDVL